MSPEKELAIGREVGDGEFNNLRTYNLLFFNSFLFLIALLLTLSCVSGWIYPLSQQVSPEKDSAVSLWLEAFKQWVGSGADVALSLFYSCTNHVSATNLQKAAVFTDSWERFKPDFISRMTFNMKCSMKHSFCCMKIAHFRNISTRSISVTKLNREYSGSCCKCPNTCPKWKKSLCDLKLQFKSLILQPREFLTHAKEMTLAPSITFYNFWWQWKRNGMNLALRLICTVLLLSQLLETPEQPDGSNAGEEQPHILLSPDFWKSCDVFALGTWLLKAWEVLFEPLWWSWHN